MTGAIQLPVPTLTAAAAWQFHDWRSVKAQTPPAPTNGVYSSTATLTIPVPDDELWLMDRAVVQCTSPTKTTLRLYETSVDPLQLLGGSSFGTFDEGEWNGGLLLRPSSTLLAQWTQCNAGAVGTIRAQVRVFRKV
jgi:hypothetical protein